MQGRLPNSATTVWWFPDRAVQLFTAPREAESAEGAEAKMQEGAATVYSLYKVQYSELNF